VFELAVRLATGGADEIVFADTIGVAVHRMVKELVGQAVTQLVQSRSGFTLHNTRNTGSNASRPRGRRDVFDASLGGIGLSLRTEDATSPRDLVYF